MDYIPNTDEIGIYIHCARCLQDKPDDVSPEAWARLGVGFTKIGLQVVCVRCNHANVISIDFEGHRHPSNITAPEENLPC